MIADNNAIIQSVLTDQGMSRACQLNIIHSFIGSSLGSAEYIQTGYCFLYRSIFIIALSAVNNVLLH